MKKLFLLLPLLLIIMIFNFTGCSLEEFIWHYIGDSGAPSFLNGWQNWENGFEKCAYGKDALGFVYLQGMANNPSNYNGSNQLVFVLPAGYRPLEVHLYYVYASSTDNSALVYIFPSGNVTIYDIDNGGPSATASFSGIEFFAEQ